MLNRTSFNFMNCTYELLALFPAQLESYSESCLCPYLEVFSLNIFKPLSLKTFDLLVVDLGLCERSVSSFILLHVGFQLLSTIFEEAISPSVCNFGNFVKIRLL